MKIDNSQAKKLKKDFPIFSNNKNLIYLDNAATSQKPESVINSIVHFYENENANPGRSIHNLATKSMQRYNDARKKVSDFIGADLDEVVFTKNATESLNIIAHEAFSLIEHGRNEILLTEMEHHSNIVPWQEFAKKYGFTINFVKIRDNFTLDIADLREKLSRRTAIFAFTYVSNVLGTINPVEEISEIAKEQGAIVVIDASQAVQHVEINVKKIKCDFLAFSGHKMHAPLGIGVLYGRKELLEKMKPVNFGGGMIKKVTKEGTLFADIPEKFEAGTQNISAAIGLEEAVRYMGEIGIHDMKNWGNELTKYAIQKLNEVQGIKIYNPGVGKTVPIVSFSVEGIHPHDIAEILNTANIAIRAGHQCAMPLMEVLGLAEKGGVCRASFSFYNTFEDVDNLIKNLKIIQEKFKK